MKRTNAVKAGDKVEVWQIEDNGDGVTTEVEVLRDQAIIAMPSTAGNETYSRIVPTLKSGAGVVTSRGDVQYIVTEYGVAYLHGKTMRERAMALIHVAHPKFRPWLLAEAKSGQKLE